MKCFRPTVEWNAEVPPSAEPRHSQAAMDLRKGPIVGQKGVKYGLQKPGARPAPQQAPKAAAIFGDDSDDDDVGQQIMRQAERKRQESKVGPNTPSCRGSARAASLQRALPSTPSPFAFDLLSPALRTRRTRR